MRMTFTGRKNHSLRLWRGRKVSLPFQGGESLECSQPLLAPQSVLTSLGKEKLAKNIPSLLYFSPQY